MDRLLRFHAYDLGAADCTATRISRSSPTTSSATSPSPDAVVLDYACGEALSATKVAGACAQLYLAEPAPGVRGWLVARFAPDTRIRVRSLDELKNMQADSIDLVVMNSVAQYMTPQELDSAFDVIHRLLKPSGRVRARRYPAA